MFKKKKAEEVLENMALDGKRMENETLEPERKEEETPEGETPEGENLEPELKEEDSEGNPEARLEEAYCLGAGIDREELARAKEMLGGVADAMSGGKFNPEMIKMAFRLLNYEKDVEAARKEGYEKARTEKLEKAFRNKRSAAEEADSIPHLRGNKNLKEKMTDSIFEVAKGAW